MILPPLRDQDAVQFSNNADDEHYHNAIASASIAPLVQCFEQDDPSATAHAGPPPFNPGPGRGGSNSAALYGLVDDPCRQIYQTGPVRDSTIYLTQGQPCHSHYTDMYHPYARRPISPLRGYDNTDLELTYPTMTCGTNDGLGSDTPNQGQIQQWPNLGSGWELENIEYAMSLDERASAST